MSWPLALLVAAGAAWWLASRWLWPYRPCPRCQGHRGRNAGSTASRWGKCPRCGGSGELMRFGARLVHQALTAGRRKP